MTQDDEPSNFRMVYPRLGKRWVFSAYVTGFETSAPVGGIIGASVSLRITGKPELQDVP